MELNNLKSLSLSSISDHFQPEPKRPKLSQQIPGNHNEDDTVGNVKSVLTVIKEEPPESSISALETDNDIIGLGP